MNIKDRLHTGKTSPNEMKSPRMLTAEEIEARKFRIEPITINDRVIKLIGIESQLLTNPAYKSKLVPDNWEDQISGEMGDTSIVFMPYFPPELEKGVYSSKYFGPSARRYGEEQGLINTVYLPLTKLAEKQGKLVGVADIATKPVYELYQNSYPNRWAYLHQRSAYAVTETRSEHYWPQTVDARRMWTAKGILDTIKDYPEGSSFMYVAAPAHVNRVKRYLQEKTIADTLRYGMYASTIFGLDTSTRIYEYVDDDWALVSNKPYTSAARPLIPIFLGAGVIGGALYAKKKARSISE